MSTLRGKAWLAVLCGLAACVAIAYVSTNRNPADQRAKRAPPAPTALAPITHSDTTPRTEASMEHASAPAVTTDTDAAFQRDREQMSLAYRKLDARVTSIEERDVLEKLGYVVPDFYSALDIWTLQAMASIGDSHAMVALAEKYLLDLRDHPAATDFDPDADYVELAKELLRNAVAAGNVKAAALIAKVYLEEDDEATAQAWSQLAVSLGDVVHVRELADVSMPPEEFAEIDREARLKAPGLLNEINARRARAGRPPLTISLP